jgi:hypothetical protein
MAKVIVFTPDLLFGSSLLGALSAHGHEAVMCSNTEGLGAEGPSSQCVIVDLTDEIETRLAELSEVRESGALEGVALLGYHSHVEPESREAGIAAGIAKVVPRSRMHREPAALVESVISGQ